jgi:hypothetical protein
MSKKLTTDEFINRSNLLHNYKYDYSLVNYTKNSVKVEIICPTHGNFLQRPSTHLFGIGCKKCGIDKRKSNRAFTIEEFIEKAHNIHKDLYDYSLVKYINISTKIEILCKKCNNVFTQKPYSHLRGHGCPKCNLGGTTGWSKSDWIKICNSKNTFPIVYIIQCFNFQESFIKIGKTSQPLFRRFRCKNTMPYSFKVLKEFKGSPDYIYDKEVELHKLYKDYKYIPLITFGGYSECFNTSILEEVLKLTP